MRIFDDLPGRDHGSEWISRESGEWVYLNEPYAYNHGKADQWAAHQGFEVITSRWKGLYFPDNAVPTLFCSDKALATKLAQQLDALAIKGEQISGDETGRYWERYVSPARLASGNSPRRRPMPAPRGLVSAGSLPYGASSGGEASLWRPAVRMPLTFHHQVGPLLTALANAPLPASARRRVLRVRSTLDDWIQMEYPTNEEMSAEQFREAYYGHRHPPVVDGRGEELAAIKKVIETLSVGYAESKARRGLLKMLSEAQIAMEKHSAS